VAGIAHSPVEQEALVRSHFECAQVLELRTVNALATPSSPVEVFMFLILLSYKKPLAEVDLFVAEHRAFLEHHYAAGDFLLSGRKEPRTGGVILANASARTEVEKIVRGDPFYREEVAEYEIVEFLPSMAASHLAHLKRPDPMKPSAQH
jgi:uncharacterized protein YciI